MTTRRIRLLGWSTAALLALAAPAFADHHETHAKPGDAAHGKSAKTEPSPEARAKMADAHQQMAECLRSARPMQECHEEMMKKVHGEMHGEGCSMGHHEHGEGKAHGKSGDPSSVSKEAPKETPTPK